MEQPKWVKAKRHGPVGRSLSLDIRLGMKHIARLLLWIHGTATFSPAELEESRMWIFDHLVEGILDRQSESGDNGTA